MHPLCLAVMFKERTRGDSHLYQPAKGGTQGASSQYHSFSAKLTCLVAESKCFIKCLLKVKCSRSLRKAENSGLWASQPCPLVLGHCSAASSPERCPTVWGEAMDVQCAASHYFGFSEMMALWHGPPWLQLWFYVHFTYIFAVEILGSKFSLQQFLLTIFIVLKDNFHFNFSSSLLFNGEGQTRTGCCWQLGRHEYFNDYCLKTAQIFIERSWKCVYWTEVNNAVGLEGKAKRHLAVWEIASILLTGLSILGKPETCINSLSQGLEQRNW